jgi:hypothetical protein
MTSFLSMIKRVLQGTWFALLAGLIFQVGCSKNPTPPAPLALEQIPVELDKAFKEAKQETKDLVAKLNSSLQGKDYPAAYNAVQDLGGLPDATTEQRTLAARAMLTIYGLLQEAQAKGDDNASAALRYHQSTK